MSTYPKILSLDLAFRGGRDYIQGADIYQAIVSATVSATPSESGPVRGPLKIQMHSPARTGCELILAPVEMPISRPDKGKAEFTIGNWHGWVAETGQLIDQRLPYDEGQIARQCEVSGPIIRTTGRTPNSAAEVLIGATKILHQTLYPQAEHKWIVSRIELQRVLTDTDFAMEVELLQNLNNRLTRSVVRCASEPLGHIYFSAIKS